MANQLDALSVPNVSDECVARSQPPFELLESENSVVDLAAERLLGLADFRRQAHLIRLAHDQQVNIAGGVGFIPGE
jgi:hypothetical protein